jgi:hypothetical protein
LRFQVFLHGLHQHAGSRRIGKFLEYPTQGFTSLLQLISLDLLARFGDAFLHADFAGPPRFRRLLRGYAQQQVGDDGAIRIPLDLIQDGSSIGEILAQKQFFQPIEGILNPKRPVSLLDLLAQPFG